jgi:hypothetical protein
MSYFQTCWKLLSKSELAWKNWHFSPACGCVLSWDVGYMFTGFIASICFISEICHTVMVNALIVFRKNLVTVLWFLVFRFFTCLLLLISDADWLQLMALQIRQCNVMREASFMWLNRNMAGVLCICAVCYEVLSYSILLELIVTEALYKFIPMNPLYTGFRGWD